jgi:hypothetical protein
MRGGITPVISIVLLVLITVGASVLAFVWVTNTQGSLEESVSAGVSEAPGSETSRLQIISMRGNGITIQNVGSNSINNVSILIN